MRVLEVNNLDLQGRRFNGYDFIDNLKNIDVTQLVIEKSSKNKKVKQILKNMKHYYIYSKFYRFETENSLQNIFSITSPLLMKSSEYKNCDIVHFHLVHNSKISLYSLLEISKEKRVIISFHDPWLLTGRCVHFYDCDKWQNGCKNCPNLNTHFNFKHDNCSLHWNLKRNILKEINAEYLVHSDWMKNLLIESNIDNINLIPLGIDINKFKIDNYKNSREYFNINDKEKILFFRSSDAFKGTNYIIEALDKYINDENITIMTCGKKNLINKLKNKYKIIELGTIENEKLFKAYSACDIFLMPSTAESFGMMAIEAMAFSKPVIIFDNTALPAVTHAPECGYLVEDKNSKKLALAIKELLENDEERKKRGILGRKIVEENYNIENYNKNIEKLYQKVFNKKLEIINKNIELSNDINLLTELNKLTKQIFGNNSKITKKLLYDCKESSKKIDYSDLKVQARINDYSKKILEEIDNNYFYIPIKYKIKYMIEKNKYLKQALLERRKK